MRLSLDFFNDLHVLVIGDVMIDQYMNGNVFRKSPEADIPVLENVTLLKKLGGAANVAKNIFHLGAKASLLSVCGDDNNQEHLLSLLKKYQISAYLIKDSDRQTTIKTRVFADKTQLVRVDQEDKQELSEKINNQLLESFENILKKEQIDILLLQDYNKGVLGKQNISKLIKMAKSKGIFIAVDPKVDNFYEYKEVELFKPNLKELNTQFPNAPTEKGFNVVGAKILAEKVRSEIVAKTILVTLSEHGAMLLTETESYYKATKTIDVVDVCGAGDAVMAVTAMAMFKGIENDEILELCNETGRIVCEKTGVESIHISELNI